jgi:hypothetical protein
LEIEEAGAPEFAVISMAPELAAITQGDFALEAWFKSTDAARSIIMGGCCDAGAHVNLELHDGNDVRIYVSGPSDTTDLRLDAPGGIDTRDGEWHHLIGQREGDTVSLWLDGLFAGSMTDVAGAYTIASPEMFVGRDMRTGDTRFDGNLDDVRIWGRALSAGEIQSLAAGNVPIPEPAGLSLLVFGLVSLLGLGCRQRTRAA